MHEAIDTDSVSNLVAWLLFKKQPSETKEFHSEILGQSLCYVT